MTAGAGRRADAQGVPLVAMADLVAVMDRLRSPGGCPWDAEQTHASLVRYAVEEVYEVAEAVETDDRAGLLEELGDLLLQVVFHARVAAEHPDDPFDLEDVAAGVAAKLRRRHPHVFAEASVRDAAHVHERWEQIKAAEKARTSVLDGIPPALPALGRAQKVVSRLGRVGLTPADALGDAAGVASQAAALDPADPVAVGHALLDIAARAQLAGVDAEAALRAATRGLETQVRAAERRKDGPGPSTVARPARDEESS